MSELCAAYSLEPEDMVAKWVSFAYKLKNLQDINPDTLIDFEKKVCADRLTCLIEVFPAESNILL